MTIKQAFQQVLSSSVPNYQKPVYWTICDIPVVYKPVRDGVSSSEWKDTLDEWLPHFQKAGWLDYFQKIIIGENEPRDSAVGEYKNTGYILLENNVRRKMLDGVTFDNSREYIFTHEMVHHAHRINGGFGPKDEPLTDVKKMRSGVSFYAGESRREAVAEIGAGIIHGYEMAGWAHEYYEENDGPMEVYDIAKTLR